MDHVTAGGWNNVWYWRACQSFYFHPFQNTSLPRSKDVENVKLGNNIHLVLGLSMCVALSLNSPYTLMA